MLCEQSYSPVKSFLSIFMLQKNFFCYACERLYMWAVSSTIGGVGVYLVHICVRCNFPSEDSSKFAVVMVVSGRVIAA